MKKSVNSGKTVEKSEIDYKLDKIMKMLSKPEESGLEKRVKRLEELLQREHDEKNDLLKVYKSF